MNLLLGLAALAAPPTTSAEVHHLDNGLTVVIEEDHRSDQIALMIAYQVGARDERAGERGCAHLFEHLMFEGSANVGNNKFDEWLTAGGGSNNAWTSDDGTVYHMVFPAGALDLALFLESDRLGFLEAGLDQTNLSNQSEVVLQERYQGYAEPHGRDYDALTTMLYGPGHPYHVPVIGTVADVQGFQVGAVVDFWKRHYRPRNAILTIVGHVDSDVALERIRHWFSDIPDRGPAEPREPVWAGGHGAGTGVVYDQVEDRSLAVAWPTVPAAHADAAALEVLSWVLSGGAGTRLDDAMYLESRVATSASAWTSMSEIDGMFVIDAASDRSSIPKLLKAIDAVLADFTANPTTAGELKRAVKVTSSSLEESLEDPESRAWLLTQCLMQRGDPNCLPGELARYAAVTSADLARVASTYLVPEARVVLATVPEGDRSMKSATPVELP
jgi:zinc protease